MEWSNIVGVLALVFATGCDDGGADETDTDPGGSSGAGSSGGPGQSTTVEGTSGVSTNPGTSSPSSTGTVTTDDAATESSSGGGSTGAPAKGVPVFFAAGDVGRTTFSCDLGQSWTGNRSFDLEQAPNLGAVAVDPESGTFVAVRGGWQNWYDAQEFYRSADGVTWSPLEAGALEGSHRIRRVCG